LYVALMLKQMEIIAPCKADAPSLMHMSLPVFQCCRPQCFTPDTSGASQVTQCAETL
jgi:hypothetical protein